MVLAERVEGDPAGDDELVVAAVVGEGGRVEALGPEHLLEDVDHPSWRLADALALDVDAEGLQHLAGGVLGPAPVEAHGLRRARLRRAASRPRSRIEAIGVTVLDGYAGGHGWFLEV